MTNSIARTLEKQIFQLTSSRRGWRLTRWSIVQESYFNSHPHEEDDDDTISKMRGETISTHILTKRMTSRACSIWHDKSISTHILTKRMTVSESTRKERRKYFNSHPHEEDDIRFRNIWRTASAFQLTSSRRGWHEGDTESLKVMAFQLTSSRRGWLFFRAQRIWKGYFNSHPHEEDDKELWQLFLEESISTHILTKRMTIPCHLKHRRWLLFQLTSSRRGWPHFRHCFKS